MSSARIVAASLAATAGFMLVGCARQEQPATTELASRYEHASAYLPWRIRQYVDGLTVQPEWSVDGQSLRFQTTNNGRTEYVQVDLSNGGELLRSEQPPETKKTSAEVPRDVVVSRNGLWGVRVIDGNLYRIEIATGKQTQLTTDAEPDYAYGLVPHSDLRSLSKRLANDPLLAFGVWSPDGHKFLTYRVDERGLYKLPFVVSIVPGAKHQVPYVHYQNTAWPDSEKIQLGELMVFDMRTGKRTNLQIPKPRVAFEPTPEGGLRWSPDGTKVFAAPESLDYRSITVYEADVVTGKARAVASDAAKLPFRPDVDEAKRFYLVGNGEQIVLYSERSDWGHLYLYDAATGQLKNAITQGEWAVHEVKRVDSAGGWVYFTAGGREADRDPYYSHLYRVRLDGSELTLLTPENAQHNVQFSPDGRYFVDSYSTVTEAPVHVLRASDGTEVKELLRADVSRLVKLGWTPPIRFKVKAADNETDLYGVLFLPFDFDKQRSYPIIDAQYSGTQTLVAPREFLKDRWNAMALAQVGFAVMHFDGRATPLRRQSMQDIGFGTGVASQAILEDHIAAMKQLAERYGFIDIERAGIYGHSWGGYRAARALLQFPEFFKVGVATAGSHDNYLFVSGHNRWYGRPQEYPESYDKQSNMELAANLKGKLLLAHGANDDDVHMALTLQLADALIRENKDFDLFIHPTRNHKDLWQDGYMIRKSWDYFAQHLLHATPPTGVKVPDYDGPAYQRTMSVED
ncbi:S9 family peptidase [Peristeroidobacter soli]|uniref:S9 family peptidase n=1 Tax=Peristeroidobacter soli TaxID=2497877 RepID=UPI00101DC337|nr:DPP IV N-terminal domain-containing protein [Peristeroidobacter soli]